MCMGGGGLGEEGGGKCPPPSKVPTLPFALPLCWVPSITRYELDELGGGEEKGPFQNVLSLECEQMNRLLLEVHRSLIELGECSPPCPPPSSPLPVLLVIPGPPRV